MSYMTKDGLTKKQKALLQLVEQREAVVIYQLAKDAGRSYRRVYDNIQMFVEKEFVELERVKINNRNALKVRSLNPYYQRLIRLDEMYEAALNLSLSEKSTHSSMSLVVRKMSSIFHSHGAVLGGVCANLHGVEQFEKTVELAVDLSAKKTMKLLTKENINAIFNLNDTGKDPAWVISGDCDGISYQIVPAHSVGVNVDVAIEQIGIRIVSEEDFITSRCIEGGFQDLHDVAVMALQNRKLMWFAMQQSDVHSCRDKFDVWLADERLLSRYGDIGKN
ncbi:MAG: hypothetical protein ABUK11_01910 [Mariprofundaceae bacterium]